MTPEVLAIIMARGGSKGLPGKHLLRLNGKRVLEYTIEYALLSKHLTRIVLSTDDMRISAVASMLGIETLFRPAKMAADTSRIQEGMIYTLETLKSREGYEPEYIALLYGSVPIRKPGLLDQGIAYIAKQKCKSVRSVVPVKQHPYWVSEVTQTNEIVPFMKTEAYRRQDVPPLYCDDGGVVLYSREGLYETRHTARGFTDDSHALIIDPMDASIDIDDAHDLELAEHIMVYRSSQPRVDDTIQRPPQVVAG